MLRGESDSDGCTLKKGAEELEEGPFIVSYTFFINHHHRPAFIKFEFLMEPKVPLKKSSTKNIRYE